MLKRLSDKTIGRKIITQRFYNIDSQNWYKYNKMVSSVYNDMNNILADTVNTHTTEIKDIKLNVSNLLDKINENTMSCNNMEQRLLMFSIEITKILDEISKKIDKDT